MILDVLWGFPAQTKTTRGDEENRLWSRLACVLTQPCCSPSSCLSSFIQTRFSAFLSLNWKYSVYTLHEVL